MTFIYRRLRNILTYLLTSLDDSCGRFIARLTKINARTMDVRTKMRLCINYVALVKGYKTSQSIASVDSIRVMLHE